MPFMKCRLQKAALCLIIAALFLSFSGCLRQSVPYTRSGFYLDTLVNITVYDTDSDHAAGILDQAMERCMYYDRLFSISDPESDIYKLNHANNAAVTVSDETYTLLQLSMRYAEESGGLFDITVQPLYALWDFQAPEHETLPDEAAIKSALTCVNQENIEFPDDHSVRLKNHAQINPGAIAKGYIADMLKEDLLRQGVSSALINLGGNIQTIGSKPDGSDYQIGLQKPFEDNGEMISQVSVSDKSVVTSGIYQRCFTYDGKIYHHILNPENGYPAETDLNAAVVIASSSVDADAYSTICMLLGHDKACDFIKKHPEVSAVLIDKNNQITTVP